MKKLFALLICISALSGVLSGCGCNSTEPYPIEQGTSLPPLAEDTAASPLGQFDETSAFGIVREADDDGLLLEMQGKYYLFGWTEKSRRHYDKLGVKLGDEVGVKFHIADGAFVAETVELVTAGELSN